MSCGFARSDVIAEVGRCGCCTDLACQNGQLVACRPKSTNKCEKSKKSKSL